MTLATFPLTEAQEGLWYAQRLAPANPIYNTGQYVEIDGTLDVVAFTRAVTRACDEAVALSLRVVEQGDRLEQVVDPVLVPRLRLVDVSADADPHAAALALIEADMAVPVDPTRGPLAAQVLYRLGEGRHVWYQRVHHLVVDGFGTALLSRRVAALYGEETGQAAAGAPLAPLGPVVDEDTAWRRDPRRDKEQDYWAAVFREPAPDQNLAPGLATTADRFHRVAGRLEGEALAGLHRLATAFDLTWPDVLVGLVGAYVGRHAATRDVVLGVPSMGRMGSASARVPAMVMNVLPVRLAVGEDLALGDYLIGVARALRQARRHGRYRSEQVRRDLGLVGGTRRLHGPLVNILPFEQPLDLAGLATRMVTLGTGAVDDLTFTFRADPSGRDLRLELDSNPNLFSAVETQAHADRLLHFIGGAVVAERLADVPSLTPEEAHHWLFAVNDTAHPVPDVTLTALIEAAFDRFADRGALRFAGHELTYAALERESRALAQRLVAAGAGPGRVVAIAQHRSLELVVSLVAVLRAGAAYLPLDPDHPPARIATIVETAQPVVALAAADLAVLLPAGVPVIVPVLGAAGEHGDLPRAGVNDPAYVIFTSGSTGAPKGVVNLHAGIVNRLEWMRCHYGIGPDDRILQKTPATFDVSVWEFFLPLISGATLVIAAPGLHRDPAALAAVMQAERISVLHFVPSMLAAFLDEPAAARVSSRQVFCSGEALPAPLRDRFHGLLPGVELHNLYGPTEAAVDVTFWPASADDHSQPVPIGFPVWNTALHVLDDRLRPVPPGTVGDLYIAGIQVAAGYLGQPGLTAERFLADPFRPGGRMYKTGDVARYRADGALIFLGRSDHQVKIRGLRIELDEIEVQLARLPGIAQAAVITAPGQGGDARILAYAVATEGGAPDPADLRRQLATHLPDYMVPAAVTLLAALPVTGNGKLDRARLPLPVVAATPGRAPATPAEAVVARLFGEVLGHEAVGADDDFFALGGHSLLAARLALRLRAEFGGEIGLGAVFEHQTVARLAAWLDQAERGNGHGLGPVITLARGEGAPLFCIHPAGGIGWCYRDLARALDPARPVHAIQARGLDPAAPLPASMEAMAADYVREIRSLWPSGPYHLIGWSVGGIIAQVVAAQLQAEGAQVGLLAMLDSYPCEVWRAEPLPAPGAALKALLYIAGHDPEQMGDLPLTREAVVGFLRGQGHALGALDDETLSGVIRVVEANDRLVRGHQHRHFNGAAVHFRAISGETGKVIDPAGWSPHLARLERHELPFLHGFLTGAEAVRLVAPVIAPYLNGQAGVPVSTISSTMI